MADDPAPEPTPQPTPTPAPTPTPTPAPAPVPPSERPLQGDTYPAAYVHELRTEAKDNRLEAAREKRARAAAEEALAAEKTAKEQAIADKAAAETEKTATKTAADQRIIMAELRTAATKAGMVDLDGLKLADLTAVTLDDNGEVQGAEALMTALKTAKPYLFGAPIPGNSRPGDPPRPAPTAAKKASEMTDEEFQEANRKIAKGVKPSDTLR